jgi:nitrate/nitrite-specific signal transduction histidine kinase
MPILTLEWSLGVAAPVEEITASTTVTATQIAEIAGDTSRLGPIASIVAVVLLAGLLSLVLRRQIIQPLTTLVSATKSIASGDLQPITVQGQNEIGELARSFNAMTESRAASRADLTAANQQLEQKIEERTTDLTMTLAKLAESLAPQQDLLSALREVSTPVIPVMGGVLAMPW